MPLRTLEAWRRIERTSDMGYRTIARRCVLHTVRSVCVAVRVAVDSFGHLLLRI